MKMEMPQCFADWQGRGPELSLRLLVAGGRPPEQGWLVSMAARYPVWAVDRGVEICRQAGIKPELLIGDADSASAETWSWAGRERLEVIRHSRDKDLTDLQLALKELAIRRPGSAVLLTGGWGGRFDHAFTNLFSLQEAAGWQLNPCGLADAAEAMFFVDGGQSLVLSFSNRPQIISLLPLTEVCEGVNFSGVHWPLAQSVLRLDSPAAISNRLAQDSLSATISLRLGRIGVYCCWDEADL